MKIVLNTSYGGFELSAQAIVRMAYLGDEWALNALQEMRPDQRSYWKVPENRSNPILVQVVEEMGEEANGECSRLQVVEIDEPKLIVTAFDGKEKAHWQL